MSRYLVPAATEFLDLVQIDSGLRVALGDPKVEAGVGPDIVRAHIALREGVKKISALAEDPTRTEVARHLAAKKVAGAVVAELTKTKAAIERRATDLRTEALRQVDLQLGPTADKAALHSEVRAWIRDAAKNSDGLERIRVAMKEDGSEIAAVLWHSPRYLLGLPSAASLETLRLEALEGWRPDLYAALETSANLDELLGKYQATVNKIETAFYNPAMAAQASKRVEV